MPRIPTTHFMKIISLAYLEFCIHMQKPLVDADLKEMDCDELHVTEKKWHRFRPVSCRLWLCNESKCGSESIFATLETSFHLPHN
jgi:hypothetical protein